LEKKDWGKWADKQKTKVSVIGRVQTEAKTQGPMWAVAQDALGRHRRNLRRLVEEKGNPKTHTINGQGERNDDGLGLGHCLLRGRKLA